MPLSRRPARSREVEVQIEVSQLAVLAVQDDGGHARGLARGVFGLLLIAMGRQRLWFALATHGPKPAVGHDMQAHGGPPSWGGDPVYPARPPAMQSI